jgi:hypothetical protein
VFTARFRVVGVRELPFCGVYSLSARALSALSAPEDRGSPHVRLVTDGG